MRELNAKFQEINAEIGAVDIEGWEILPSEPDDRDYIWEELSAIKSVEHSLATLGTEPVVSYPVVLDLRHRLPAVKNQGARGTCSAFAASAIREYQEALDTKKTIIMSPNFIYFHRMNKPGAGMYGRDTMDILLKYGCCREETFPYTSAEPSSVSSGALTEAGDYRIASYARVTTIEGLKEALFQKGPCWIAFPVYSTTPQFWRRVGDEAMRGGHAVAVVGYTELGFIIRNSWGKTWNGDGHVLYEFAEWGAHWEIWSCVDVPGSPAPPEPQGCKCTVL